MPLLHRSDSEAVARLKAAVTAPRVFDSNEGNVTYMSRAEVERWTAVLKAAIARRA